MNCKANKFQIYLFQIFTIAATIVPKLATIATEIETNIGTIDTMSLQTSYKIATISVFCSYVPADSNKRSDALHLTTP